VAISNPPDRKQQLQQSGDASQFEPWVLWYEKNFIFVNDCFLSLEKENRILKYHWFRELWPKLPPQSLRLRTRNQRRKCQTTISVTCSSSN
jgi:hypothetical protein